MSASISTSVPDAARNAVANSTGVAAGSVSNAPGGVTSTVVLSPSAPAITEVVAPSTTTVGATANGTLNEPSGAVYVPSNGSGSSGVLEVLGVPAGPRSLAAPGA